MTKATSFVFYAQEGPDRIIATITRVARDTAILTVNGDDLTDKVIRALPRTMLPGHPFWASVLIHHPTDVQVWKVSLFSNFNVSFAALEDLISKVLNIKPVELVETD